MSFSTTPPTRTGIYLARMLNSGDVVSATVAWIPYLSAEFGGPGYYCTRYAGENVCVSHGHPRGKPMGDLFQDWYLVYDYGSGVATTPTAETPTAETPATESPCPINTVLLELAEIRGDLRLSKIGRMLGVLLPGEGSSIARLSYLACRKFLHLRLTDCQELARKLHELDAARKANFALAAVRAHLRVVAEYLNVDGHCEPVDAVYELCRQLVPYQSHKPAEDNDSIPMTVLEGRAPDAEDGEPASLEKAKPEDDAEPLRGAHKVGELDHVRGLLHAIHAKYNPDVSTSEDTVIELLRTIIIKHKNASVGYLAYLACREFVLMHHNQPGDKVRMEKLARLEGARNAHAGMARVVALLNVVKEWPTDTPKLLVYAVYRLCLAIAWGRHNAQLAQISGDKLEVPEPVVAPPEDDVKPPCEDKPEPLFEPFKEGEVFAVRGKLAATLMRYDAGDTTHLAAIVQLLCTVFETHRGTMLYHTFLLCREILRARPNRPGDGWSRRLVELSHAYNSSGTALGRIARQIAVVSPLPVDTPQQIVHATYQLCLDVVNRRHPGYRSLGPTDPAASQPEKADIVDPAGKENKEKADALRTKLFLIQASPQPTPFAAFDTITRLLDVIYNLHDSPSYKAYLACVELVKGRWAPIERLSKLHELARIHTSVGSGEHRIRALLAAVTSHPVGTTPELVHAVYMLCLDIVNLRQTGLCPPNPPEVSVPTEDKPESESEVSPMKRLALRGIEDSFGRLEAIYAESPASADKMSRMLTTVLGTPVNGARVKAVHKLCREVLELRKQVLLGKTPDTAVRNGNGDAVVQSAWAKAMEGQRLTKLQTTFPFPSASGTVRHEHACAAVEVPYGHAVLDPEAIDIPDAVQEKMRRIREDLDIAFHAVAPIPHSAVFTRSQLEEAQKPLLELARLYTPGGGPQNRDAGPRGSKGTSHAPGICMPDTDPRGPVSFPGWLDVMQVSIECEVTSPDPVEYEHVLDNGRKYKLVDTGTPYKAGEYPSGGILLHAWEPRSKGGEGAWVYVDHSPDAGTAREFLRHASRLPPIPEG